MTTLRPLADKKSSFILTINSNMKQIIYNDYTELSVKTAEQIAAIIYQKPDALLCSVFQPEKHRWELLNI